MRVFNEIGSKERFLEMFENVNKLKLNEEGIVTEGVYDQAILKGFILGGGPGSGKSYVSNEIFGLPSGFNFNNLTSYGLKVIASDIIFEYYLKQQGHNPKDLGKISDEDPELYNKLAGKTNSIRSRASDTMKLQTVNYLNGRLGIVLDGTAQDIDKITKLENYLNELGYDTWMVYVRTSLEVALVRNRKRERTLDDSLVTKIWNTSNDALNNVYSGLFGDRLIIIDNSVNKPVDKEITSKIRALIQQPVQNPIGQKWIQNELEKKRNKTVEL